MTGDDPRSPDPARWLHDLQHDEALRHRPIPPAPLDPHLILLRTWQSNRLAQTYADLLVDDRYNAACCFFLSDIYAPCDFSQRDYDMQRIQAFFSHVFPPHAFKLLTNVIELNALTHDLDDALLRVLVDKLGVTDNITPKCYAEGYRLCHNYDQRMHQIDLIVMIPEQLMKIRLPVVGLALKVVRVPANRAGWVELYDFLERGYAAFKQVRDPEFFIHTVQERETRILNRIYAGSPDPFVV
jgi:hypothetical protein